MEEGKQFKAVELWSGKKLLEPCINQKTDTIEEKESPSLDEENVDGWVELKRQAPQPEQVKYVPKLSFSLM